ncbi:GFA family protein [Altericroceibacterium endophyticum]|uniref:GFA family protein n=1 Tax=Altericroceibacterium endophyticum TaxID=1808508 RepID=A0A6I4T435_9SPHN|nr:GFA family protein [Altericroceibacterium endophyticum]MXO64911.1 GFA family protein [Altericroceibacterium endophyticum]
MANDVKAAQCHCGTVQFSVEMPENRHVRRCNCSICAAKGYVALYVPLAALTVTDGEEELATYSFNTGAAKHRFCRNCGIHCFHQARSDPGIYGVNVACIEGMSPFDFPEVPVTDGQHHAKDNDGKVRSAGVLRFIPAKE